MKLKNWYTTKEFSDICKISTRTLERRRDKLLKHNPDLNWFRLKNKPYKYSFKMMSEFISPQFFDLIQRNRSLSNTIKCIHRNGSLEQHLTFADWNYYITITYKNPISKDECRNNMRKLYDKLESNCSGDTRMFYTTETHTLSNGNHNHFVLKSDLKLYQVRELISSFQSFGIIDVQRYDHELAGIFYICKEIKYKENSLYWGILGNNLEKDGELIKKIKDASNI